MNYPEQASRQRQKEEGFPGAREREDLGVDGFFSPGFCLG